MTKQDNHTSLEKAMNDPDYLSARGENVIYLQKQVKICPQALQQAHELQEYMKVAKPKVHADEIKKEVKIGEKVIGKVKAKTLWHMLQLEKYREKVFLQTKTHSIDIKSDYLKEIIHPFRHTNIWVIISINEIGNVCVGFKNPSVTTFFIREIPWQIS